MCARVNNSQDELILPHPFPVPQLQEHNLIPPNRRVIHTTVLPSITANRDRVLGNEDGTAGPIVRAKVRLDPRVDHRVLPGDPGVRRRQRRRVAALVAAGLLGPERGPRAIGVAVAYGVPEGGSGPSPLVGCHLV